MYFHLLYLPEDDWDAELTRVHNLPQNREDSINVKQHFKQLRLCCRHLGYHLPFHIFQNILEYFSTEEYYMANYSDAQRTHFCLESDRSEIAITSITCKKIGISYEYILTGLNHYFKESLTKRNKNPMIFIDYLSGILSSCQTNWKYRDHILKGPLDCIGEISEICIIDTISLATWMDDLTFEFVIPHLGDIFVGIMHNSEIKRIVSYRTKKMKISLGPFRMIQIPVIKMNKNMVMNLIPSETITIDIDRSDLCYISEDVGVLPIRNTWENLRVRIELQESLSVVQRREFTRNIRGLYLSLNYSAIHGYNHIPYHIPLSDTLEIVYGTFKTK